MKTFLVEYTDPRLNIKLNEKIQAEDKTEARDKFFELFEDIELIDRITWIPDTVYHE